MLIFIIITWLPFWRPLPFQKWNRKKGEKSLQVNDNHHSTSGQIASPPSQSWGTHKLPYPLSPSALDAWSGIKDRSPLSLWSPWGYHNISPVSVSLLCCLNSSCSCVSLSDRGELWNLMLNNHNYSICRQGQYHVDKGGGGKRLRQGRLGPVMWPVAAKPQLLSISPADLFIASQHRHHYINTVPAASEISGKYFPCGTPHFSHQIQFHPFNCFFLLIIGWEGDLISKAILISLISDGGLISRWWF